MLEMLSFIVPFLKQLQHIGPLIKKMNKDRQLILFPNRRNLRDSLGSGAGWASPFWAREGCRRRGTVLGPGSQSREIPFPRPPPTKPSF